MDIFKQMGITVGTKSLIEETTQKSLSENEKMEGGIVRKGYGHNPREALEAQISKGGVSVEGLEDTHGESHHSDNDKEVEKLQKETKEVEVEKSLVDSDLILKALGSLCEEPNLNKKKSIAKKGDLKIEVTHKKDELDKSNKLFPVKPSLKVPVQPKDEEQKKEEKEAAIVEKSVPKIPGVSKKEIAKIASLHENSPEVAERPKKPSFIKSQGPGGMFFDFGGITGNPLADNATALLQQTQDPAQAAVARHQKDAMDKAMINYVTKGEAAHMAEYGEGQSGDLNGGNAFDKPFDQQVKESFEKGEFGGNNTPAPITRHSDTEMTLPNGEVIKGMSETDAAVIEMMKGMMNAHDESGVIVEAGGNKVTVDI